jgi:hypothetical protein
MKKQTKSPTVGRSPCLCQGAGPALSELLRRLAPPDQARRHFETARIEFLKGLRAVLDARIERHSKPKARGQAINIE